MKKVVRYVISIFLSLLTTQASSPSTSPHIYKESDIHNLYRSVADQIIKLIQQNPKAIIILPTGSTPLPLYKELIQRFKNDPSIDFSKIKFFNLDEYVGLEAGHPLSYSYYMDYYFYEPLQTIDASRAPQKDNIHIPIPLPGESPKQTAARYEQELVNAIKDSPLKAVDLAILGVGGAYPEKDSTGVTSIKGGHIAFNEPETPLNQRTFVATLTEKTRLDTGYRFSALKELMKTGEIKGLFKTDVPLQAISLGIENIMGAKCILVLATGEDKAPVVQSALNGKINPNFPVSYLQRHQNVEWYIDEQAASLISKAQTPVQEKENLKHRLQQQVDPKQLPSNKTILVISPHPDDDVICMSATLKALQNKNNIIYVLYAVTGSNAVRETEPLYQKLYAQIKAENSSLSESDCVNLTKAKVREEEAKAATSKLGIPADHLIFFRAKYYKRRGIPGIKAIENADLEEMKRTLEKIKPDYVFFAAENDPHGAHGLSTELVAQTIQNCNWNVGFYGYRGAYNEWPLADETDLLITPFNQSIMDIKVEAIKAHVSQLDPLFPSFDPRPFWQRAYERNKESGQQLSDLAGIKTGFAEVFKGFSKEEFCERYA